MAGVMYIAHNIGTASVTQPHYRAIRIRRTGNHTLFGRIRFDNDILFPSMEDSRDICVYTMGPEYSDDADCPHFTYEANGRPHADSEIAMLGSSGNTVRDIPSTAGHYIATTKRYTTKISSSDYFQYDSALHRRAGVVGITSDTDVVNQHYDDLAHGGLFTFDTGNNNPPCFMVLAAVRNIQIHGVYIRHTSTSYSSSWIWNYDFNAWGHSSGSSGASFYCKSQDMLEGPWPILCYVYTIPQYTLIIDGNPYSLVVAYWDMPYLSAVSTLYKSFESPYLRISRPDTTSLGRIYILDEAVTIHKPYVT